MTKALVKKQLEPVSILGEEAAGGTYVLRMSISQKVSVRFGRFQQGNAILVPVGECLYVGSAMRGLGARLLRHASRTNPTQPHPLRALMEPLFVAQGLVKEKRPYASKRLHWHIDYLLEQSTVELTHVIVLCNSVRLETAVAQKLLSDRATCIIAPGLGAADDPGSTHLMGVRADELWWRALPKKLLLLAEAAQSTHTSPKNSNNLSTL